MDYHSALSFFTLLEIQPLSIGVTTVLVILFMFFFFLSFMVSGGEVAFLSLSEKDLNILKTRRQPSYRRIATLLEQPRTLQNSLLISNIFLAIGMILTGNILINAWLPPHISENIWLRILIKFASLSLIVVLFSEILPKLWASHSKIRFAANASLVIEVFNSVFFGLSNRLAKITENIDSRFSSADEAGYNDREIDYEIDQLPDHEVSSDEKQILKGIRKFAGTRVKQVMRTRMDVHGIPTNTSFGNVLKLIEDLHYSRIPVYKNDLDEITGMLHTKDLLAYLNEDDAFEWQKLLRPPFFVHEYKPIEDLLQEFRTRRSHFAIVVDEFGGTSGIVTLEDIMEEIIGDIKDEFDTEESGNQKIDDHNFVFEGRLMINDACRAMGLPKDTFDGVRGESDSVAGLVLEIAGRFPAVNEQIVSGDFIFTPLEINRNRMEKIKITIQQQS